MSVDAFEVYLGNLKNKVARADRTWFVRWLRRYANFYDCDRRQPLEITEDDVRKFSRSLRDTNVPAFQRLQAVRAVEHYIQNILKRS